MIFRRSIKTVYVSKVKSFSRLSYNGQLMNFYMFLGMYLCPVPKIENHHKYSVAQMSSFNGSMALYKSIYLLTYFKLV